MSSAAERPKASHQSILLRIFNTEAFCSSVVAVSFVSTAFFFGPERIYFANMDEISISLPRLLALLAPLGLGLVLLCIGIYYLLPKPARVYWLAIQSALTVAAFVQGNFLLWNYGKLLGNEIDWTPYTGIGVIEALNWLVIVTYFVYFAKRMRPKIHHLALGLILVRWISLSVDTFQAPRLWEPKGFRNASDKFYEFSSKENAVLLLLDGFQSTVLPKIFEREPALRDELKGFTFYRDQLGSFQNTAMSVPLMLTGQAYKNEEDSTKFFERTLSTNSLPNALRSAGFDVRLGMMDRYCGYFADGDCAPLSAIAERDSLYNELHIAAAVLDITLFRYSPHYLKMLVYNNQKWLIRGLFFKRNRPGYFWHKRAILAVENYEDLGRVGDENPRFKMLHMLIPHSPFEVDSNCYDYGDRKIEVEEKYIGQATCALKLGIRFLHRLRDLGILEKTLVVIAADHGLGFDYRDEKKKKESLVFEGEYYSRPLLLIKPIGAKGELQVSDLPTAVEDIPITISSQLRIKARFPGEIIGQAMNKRRERHFYWLEKGAADVYGVGYLPPLHEFIIKGSAFDRKSWSRGKIFFGPESGQAR